MEKKGVLALTVLFILLSLWIAMADYNETIQLSPDLQKIENMLYEQGTVGVIVKLREPPALEAWMLAGDEENKIKQLEDSVLGGLNLAWETDKEGAMSVPGADFHLKHRYSTVPAFAGEVTAPGLEKLKRNPDVEGIYLDKRVHAMLSESSPLINATAVLSRQVNGVNLTGKGETVCIIDTGIDYIHPAIGSPACSPSTNWVINGTPESHPLEYHPYRGGEDRTWTITKPGYSRMAVHFHKIDVEKDVAYIFIKDAGGDIVQAYSGQYQDEWTFSVSGDTIKINLVNYGPFPGYGFEIDRVLNGSASIIWENCGDFIGGYDGANFDMDPMDDDGHGTHVAGIITSDDGTYKGVAPDAKIVAVKALDKFGWGYDSAIIASIDGCIRHSQDFNISVISLSLGSDCGKGYCYSNYCDSRSVYSSFINKAAEKNIFVAAATGNNYDLQKICEPACVKNATPVGSSEDGSGGTVTDRISSFSNRWDLPMVFAPGDSIKSARLGGGFVTKTGTSMSVPHVSAVAAIMYQYARLKGIGLTPQKIEDILIATGKHVGGQGKYYSRVDALSAVEYMEAPGINFAEPTTQSGNHAQNFIAANVTASSDFDNIDTLTVDLYVSAGIFRSNSSYSSQLFVNFSGLPDGTYYLNASVNNTIDNKNHTETRTIVLNTTATGLPGDADGNCVVNIFDLAKVGLCYGCSYGEDCWHRECTGMDGRCGCSKADVHPNNVINIFDLATVGLNYGRGC